MTVIRDPSLPIAVGEPIDGSRLRPRFLVLFAASALGLTVANLAVAAYLVRIASDARALQTELQKLDAVEKRIRANLDVVNQGVQARLEDLDASVRDAVAELRSVRSEVQLAPHEPDRGQTAALEPQASEVASFADEQIVPEVETDTAPTAAPPAKARKPKATAPASKVASSYQRTETPDGKVYYRRLK